MEHTFVNKDAVATLKLGQARGIALLVPAQVGLTVGEYAPNAVKKTVVGVGHAAKVQVDHMVRLQLPGVEIAGPDAADALAMAICHAHHLQSAGRLAGGAAEGGGMIGKISGRLDWRGPDHVLIDVRGRRLYRPCQRPDAGRPAGAGRGGGALYRPSGARGPAAAVRLSDHAGEGMAQAADDRAGRGREGVDGDPWARWGPRAWRGRSRWAMRAAIQAAPGVGPKLAQRVILELKAKAPGVMAMGVALAATAGAGAMR